MTTEQRIEEGGEISNHWIELQDGMKRAEKAKRMVAQAEQNILAEAQRRGLVQVPNAVIDGQKPQGQIEP